MPASSVSAGQKRKAPNLAHGLSANDRKRQKFRDATTIAAQTADAALSKAGELNIASFIKSREYEINALEKSMKKARQGLSARAFQQVPRHLRRRTASHNAKKVPRRLRGRALREMIDDKTPIVNSKTRTPTSRLRSRLETAKALKKLNKTRKTVRQKKREAKANATESDPSKHVQTIHVPRIKKNKLADLPLATSKFKRRQISKSWLPTHLWHTKRAHMTKPTEPLWRIAIPLTPTEKSYRATHRASGSRGCIAWDMSYMSTVGCIGTDTAIEGLLKRLGFHGNGWTGQKYSKWKTGSRFASGWVCKSSDKSALGIIDVLWCATDKTPIKSTQLDDSLAMIESEQQPKQRKAKLDRRIMVQIHPSAFHVFWQEVLHAAKLQKPQVLIEDLRFEIGSIEVVGPNSTEALASVLKPIEADEGAGKYWTALASLTNPALLPLNATLSFEIKDPRMLSPIKVPTKSRVDANETDLHELIVNWSFDSEVKPSRLFSHKARYIANKLPSQSAINRRRRAKLPGEVVADKATDPKIPVILLAHRPNVSNTAKQGTWTLLAPWRCIDVIWRSLMSCPLASGSKPRFGGLQQSQQAAFEQCSPWYPADFPGTDAGRAWERSQTERRFDEWIRRPPSRRIAWERLDLGLNRRGELGRGWMCDWDYLFTDSGGTSPMIEAASKKGQNSTSKLTEPIVTKQIPLTQRQRKAVKAEAEKAEIKDTKRRNTSSPEPDEVIESELIAELQYSQLVASKAKALIKNPATPSATLTPALVSVSLKLLDKGTMNDAARIYRLPTVKPTSSLLAVSDSNTNANASESSMTGTTPPGAQPPLPSLSASNALSHTHKNLDLRTRWLRLDRQQESKASIAHVKRIKTNHRGLPRQDGHHGAESLRHINVLPKNAPPEIYKQYGPKPLTEEEKELLLKQELSISIEEEKIWDVHVPCPGPEDLIGFVTTGGYNLAEGRSTAIGGLWLQRLLHGWNMDAEFMVSKSSSRSENDKPPSKIRQKPNQREERQKHLVVVRNAGENIGRLAIWELCE